MSLVYHGLKAYLITAVQTHHNRVNIIKITLCTLTNLRDIQIYCALVLEAVAQLILPKHAVKDLYSQSWRCFYLSIYLSTEKWLFFRQLFERPPEKMAIDRIKRIQLPYSWCVHVFHTERRKSWTLKMPSYSTSSPGPKLVPRPCPLSALSWRPTSACLTCPIRCLINKCLISSSVLIHVFFWSFSYLCLSCRTTLMASFRRRERCRGSSTTRSRCVAPNSSSTSWRRGWVWVSTTAWHHRRKRCLTPSPKWLRSISTGEEFYYLVASVSDRPILRCVFALQDHSVLSVGGQPGGNPEDAVSERTAERRAQVDSESPDRRDRQERDVWARDRTLFTGGGLWADGEGHAHPGRSIR